MASLNADSLITVWATRSEIRIWRKIGTNVAGSVEAMLAPSSKASTGARPNTRCAAAATTAAVIKTPTVASTTMVIHTRFKTGSLSTAPPSNRI